MRQALLAMSDEIIDVEPLEEKIVVCPNCGQRNRVHKHDRQVRFRCGRCKTELSEPFASGLFSAQSLFDPLRRRSVSKRRKSMLKFTILGLVISGIFLAIFYGRATRRIPRQLTTQEVQQVLPDQRSSMMEFANDSTSNHHSMPALDKPQPIPFVEDYASATFHQLQPLAPARSLANGAVLSQPSGAGEGTLTIDNGTSQDAVVKLVDETAQRLIVAFYIRAGSKASIKTIPDGLFRVIYGSGTDWDSAARTFTRDKSFAVFDRELNFDTTQKMIGEDVYEQHSGFDVTLHAVINGNAATSNVSESEFLKY